MTTGKIDWDYVKAHCKRPELVEYLATHQDSWQWKAARKKMTTSQLLLFILLHPELGAMSVKDVAKAKNQTVQAVYRARTNAARRHPEVWSWWTNRVRQKDIQHLRIPTRFWEWVVGEDHFDRLSSGVLEANNYFKDGLAYMKDHPTNSPTMQFLTDITTRESGIVYCNRCGRRFDMSETRCDALVCPDCLTPQDLEEDRELRKRMGGR